MPMRPIHALLAAAVLTALAQPIQADQDDPRLPTYFEQLAGAPDPLSANTIERQIWRIWYEHADEETFRLLIEGDQAMKAGDFETAMKDFNEVIERDPDFAEGWNRRATLRYMMGDYEGSMADIDETLLREPRHFGALAGLGLVNMELGRERQALDAFERALVVNPQMSGPRANAEYLRKKIEEGEI
jgi:tetratricopeptide (TPR) repeat protein